MAGYIDKARKIIEEIDHYCVYGAENWDIEADRHLSRLNKLLQKANKEQSGTKDMPLLNSMYDEQKKKIEDRKARTATVNSEPK